MTVTVERVPQYMSKNVNVILIDGKPFCTCRGKEITGKVIAKLQGCKIELLDKRIEKKAREVIE